MILFGGDLAKGCEEEVQTTKKKGPEILQGLTQLVTELAV
jgi:hypothetical protein